MSKSLAANSVDVAELISALALAGVSAELIGRVGRAIAQARQDARSAGAVRTARWRARQASQQASQAVTGGVTGDVTGDAAASRARVGDNPPKLGPLEDSRTPDSVDSETPSQLSHRAKRAATVTEPWNEDPQFEAFWQAASEPMRRRSKSRARLWPAWRAALKLCAPDALVEALRAYRRGDPDVGRSGGPGLHIWLQDRTFEQWRRQPRPAAGAGPSSPPWPGPPELWEEAVAAKDEAWARSWLAPCAFDATARTLASPTGLGVERLTRELGPALKRAGVTLIQARRHA